MTCTYLWTEVHNIVQEVANKTIPKKNKSKTAKPLRRLYEWRKVRKRESAEKSPGLRLGQLEIWGGIHCAEQCPKKGMMVRGNMQVGFNGTLEAQ